MKKKWITVASIVLLAGVFAAVAFAGSPVKLIVDGQEIKPDVAPQIINGRTMVPLRWVAEALGSGVSWDEQNRAVRITKPARPENTLPAVFQNIADKFQDLEIPVYLPAYLPAKYPLSIAEFNTSRDSYSFVIIRGDKTSPSLAKAYSFVYKP